MDENELRYFIAIAESGSLSAAADKVFVSQSALSQFLAKAERRIGTRLVRRGPSKKQELTEAGKTLFAVLPRCFAALGRSKAGY